MKRLAILILFCAACSGVALAQWAAVLSGSSAAASTGTAFVTGQTLGTLRSDGGGYSTGFKMTIGASDVIVTHLGRYKAAGDSATHVVALYDSGTTPIVGGSVTVDMSQAASPDGYVYVALASPVTLSASTVYHLASAEVNGVDHFYGADTTVTHTSVASINSAWYVLGGTAGDVGGTDNSYGPVSYKYSSP